MALGDAGIPSPRIIRRLQDAPNETFYAPETANPEMPVCVFCGGGGWQGMDHINRHDKIAESIVKVGFVVAILRHRPVAVSAVGCAALFACGFLATTLLVLPFSMALLPLLMPTAFGISACVAVAIELFNTWRGAASFAEVVDDVARGIAAVYHDPRLRGTTKGGGSLGDANRLVLVGNSSGGHLLSLLALDYRWLSALDVPPDAIRAVVDVSGVPTLCSPLWAPFRWVLRVCLFGFDGSAAMQLSPLIHAAAHAEGRRAAMNAACTDAAPSVSLPAGSTSPSGLAPARWWLVVAQFELPSLQALSCAFGAELERAGCAVTYLEVPRRLHFTAVNDVSHVLARVHRDLELGDGDGEDAVRPSAIVDTPRGDRLRREEGLCPMAVADEVFHVVDFAITSCVEMEVGAATISLPQLEALVLAASGVHRVMRARALRIGRRAYWQPERTFRPQHHAFATTASSLASAIERETTTPLPSDRPPWRVTLVSIPSQKRQCLLLTIHHCIGDGAFIATALLQTFLGVTPPTPPPQKRRAKLMGVVTPRRGVDREGGFFERMGLGRIRSGLLAWSPVAYQPAAWLLQLHAFLSGVAVAADASASLTLSCSPTLFTSPGSDIGAIREATGASVTDIVLCALAAQLRQLLAQRQRHQSAASRAPSVATAAPPSRPLLAFLPVMAGVPDMDTTLSCHCGNAVSGFLMALPVHLASPTARLRRICLQTRLAKRSHVAITMGAIARLVLRLLPRPLLPSIVPLLADAASCCGVSSLRGPAHAACKGSNVEVLYFFGLFRPPRMPLMLGASSIGDRLRITLALKLDAGRYRTARAGRPASRDCRAANGCVLIMECLMDARAVPV